MGGEGREGSLKRRINVFSGLPAGSAGTLASGCGLGWAGLDQAGLGLTSLASPRLAMEIMWRWMMSRVHYLLADKAARTASLVARSRRASSFIH